jgi:predicted CxxxxCH...CXXCH cytochrome family protein
LKKLGIKMKYYYILYIFTVVSIAIALESCSDLQTNIPQAGKVIVHKEGFTNPSSPNFHGTLIAENNWDIKSCQQCHAADFSGGTSGQSCLTCHTNAGGPEACNTCHGNFYNPNIIAPPRATNGDTSTSSYFVGAHASHLYGGTLGQIVACSACHVVPQSLYSPGHLDATSENIIKFSGVAIANIASNPNFDQGTARCSNTYCHGNFVYKKTSASLQNQFAFSDSQMVGNNVTVNWTKVDGSQMACGTCHDLPPKGHIGPIPITECYTCHGNVVDATGKIINPTLHINGKADVRGDVTSSAIKPGTAVYRLIHSLSK